MRYGLCGHALRRMARARARDLLYRSWLHPGQALCAATRTNAGFLADGERVSCLEPGRCADFIALDGSPLENISILLDRSRIHAVHLGGKHMALPKCDYDPRELTDAALVTRPTSTPGRAWPSCVATSRCTRQRSSLHPCGE
jgi:hypothetical protein